MQAVQAELEKIDLAAERDKLTNDLLTIPVAPERNSTAGGKSFYDNGLRPGDLQKMPSPATI